MKEELSQYLADFPAVPVTLTYQDATFNPREVFRALNHPDSPAFLLTGKPKEKEDGYSFICLNPEKSFRYRDHQLTVTDLQTHEQHSQNGGFATLATTLLNQYRTPRLPGLPPFTGGLAGYFAYDYAKYVTPQLDVPLRDDLKLDDAELLLVKSVIAFNHRTKEITLSQVLTKEEFTSSYQDTLAKLAKMKEQLLQLTRKGEEPFKLLGDFQMQFTLDQFVEKVATAQRHIVDGDIFQVILSNPQIAHMTGSLLGAATTVFQANPSPYQFYFHDGDFEILGASPETLITKRQESLYTYPLAGTRRRGKTKAEDDRFARELQSSAKEVAEHNMLIDLGRNDLGRVSTFGTVHVTKERALLKFSNVMHLGSTVESTVAPQLNGIDIINSVLPAGTLSGAPKVSAMQIINRLEGRKRGVYGGCLGYFDFDGDLDFCIGIRLAYRKGDQVVIHSGAGIVADSIPKREYQEFNNKASGIKNALLQADRRVEDAVLN
ncbi:anthranilate synthase component I family protein [Limosilactobacillus sp.]|jgi:anthranilate synthase component 1|uniref:anthranilate synthase component I family protein n=1 Tax=Limosilactobacillus sp. TaxID=2773925 RepID=UPI0025B80693|nr:anthranilate synthase component I family protein [Limosilactobacillus sp.]MCH3921858.1 anthranilate synthase component I family protein [Limosilactobacillus sp.]MCH3928629.1 anthranilate synthase component I family protein [Limosilactobacillus sp.]